MVMVFSLNNLHIIGQSDISSPDRSTTQGRLRTVADIRDVISLLISFITILYNINGLLVISSSFIKVPGYFAELCASLTWPRCVHACPYCFVAFLSSCQCIYVHQHGSTSSLIIQVNPGIADHGISVNPRVWYLCETLGYGISVTP